ncbi:MULTISPECIES: cobalt ECF transporter T component CbiQ [Haloferax]|uniref:Cobalt ECF transporter T component CbiQ n=1 Tax=Haloferax sp. Atlit-48N TaxID=2077198 RepID=A0ACD5HTN4_9EURY|nr:MULTISPECIES: cobalt ECF transporter T component CbiQ [Haloferax]MBC9987093.1 cobalt ECF transporter T component CbiQ [Haloferax sp. AS1]RDZ31438.1 cobalt ECF transporter T component CbiQ [Haloferax sp. Atlit-48N]RDZ34973.1 cobalt ECF transporter T component CbiQ [Haloferax sp. Atlit-24N]RDZ38708.1 cobalt ECF transporter T component CbiQ [Haloferax sp. Atlit-47N]RLM35384.1 cobalt ECF transporter T component CbiQ [Haloferax sp. Atlit-109R]
MTGVVGRSVESITGALRSVFTAEQVASSDGFLQRRDPRVSLCSVAGLALAVMITRTVAVTLCFGVVTALLARLSAVPLRQLLARSAVVPLVSAGIVVPQAVLLPGDALVRAFGFAVTDAGVAYVVLFTLRVGVGVALLSLIVMTTPFSSVVAAMRELRVPVALVWVVAVTYRYLFLFFDELQRLVLARNSRTTGQSSLRDGWRDAKRLVGTFLLRTLDRGERVGRGMRARGGSRPPSPYSRSRDVDEGDYALVALAVVAVAGSGVIRWGL